MARPMRSDELAPRHSEEWHWFHRFQRLLVERRRMDALRLLNDILEEDYPLLDLDGEVAVDRRLAWLCRIDLLRELGRTTEALAWVCLECELHPENAAAHALKEQLKRQTRFGNRTPTGRPESFAGSQIVWKGLAGMRALRAELERDIILPLREPATYRRYRVPLPNGVLLYGPPGCGKTFIARKLAELIDFTFFDFGPSDAGSIYVHGSQLRVRELFDEARRKAPALIFFDEFDALAPRRDGGLHHHYAETVNEFLVQLNECHKSRVLMVIASNFADRIDPAVLRPGRIDKRFYVGSPDLEARVELFRLYLAGRPVVGVDYLGLGDCSDHYTPAELEAVVNEAARLALSKGSSITHADLLDALRRYPPALRADEGQRTIGFRPAEEQL